MASTNKIILPITPQTNMRTTQGTIWLFRIPETCPKECEDYLNTGECRHCLSKAKRSIKRRVIRYNDYKRDLLALAQSMKFDLPYHGAGITFFMPMPVRWSKRRKIAMNKLWHQQRPDIDNLLKAVMDGLMKNDCGIAHFSYLGKKWTDKKTGYIEITLPKCQKQLLGMEASSLLVTK